MLPADVFVIVDTRLRSVAAAAHRIAHRPRLSEVICGLIEQHIARGDLVAGQALPPEKTMAEAFGVSPAVVREAVLRLRAEGRVETPRGTCALISPVGRRPTAALTRE